MGQTSPKEVVDRYYDAMRAGPAGEKELLGLFAEHATYIEPFSGATQKHEGIQAIQNAFRASWEQAPPALTITVERVDIEENQVRTVWLCDSPAFPSPVRGHDHYQIENGSIVYLEVTFAPPEKTAAPS